MLTERQQHINWIGHLIEVEGFAFRDFFLTSPRARPFHRERRRQQILQIMHRCGISAHDLVPPTTAPAPASMLFIARFENGHETCTAVLGMPDKSGLQRGLRRAQRAFTSLMHKPSPRIIAAHFKMNNVVLSHFDADEIAAVSNPELPAGSSAAGGRKASALNRS
jgi:hypothetical protein